MPTYSNEQIAKALRDCKGMVYVAADYLHCSPNTIKDRIRKVKYLQEIVDTESGRVDDTAELKLHERILAGDPWAIKFRLSTKGKDRGYVERHETMYREETLQVVTRIVRGAVDD